MPWLKSLLFIAYLTGVIHSAQAGVLIGGTRVVYDGTKKETSLSVTNQDKDTPYLIQSWVDNIEADNNKKCPLSSPRPYSVWMPVKKIACGFYLPAAHYRRIANQCIC